MGKAASGSAHGAARDVKSLFGERVEKAHSQKHRHQTVEKQQDAPVNKQEDETDLVIQLKNLRREATAFAHQISAARHTTPKALRAHELKQGSSAKLGESDGLGDGLGLVQQSFDMFQDTQQRAAQVYADGSK